MRILPSKPTPLLFTSLFLLFASVILGDNVVESLLISHFDTGVLPYMFMVNAGFLFTVSLFLIGLIDKVDRGAIFFRLLAGHAGLLILFRLLIGAEFRFVYPLLYSYAYGSKIIIFLFFWTIANDILSAREAKEAFPVIGAGGVIGGVLVSFSVIFILKIVPTRELLWLWSLLVFLPLIPLWKLRRLYGTFLKSTTFLASGKSKAGELLDDFRAVRREPLLNTMAFVYFVCFVLLFALDYLFLSTLKANFQSHYGDIGGAAISSKIASFLGLFKGFSNLCTFLLQITVAGWVLKKLGTARSTLVMPLVFTLAFSAVILVMAGLIPSKGPAFYPFFGNMMFFFVMAGLALRVSTFDSIYSPNFQIFFSTLPKEVRGRGKIFIEGIIKPMALTVCGLLIISVVAKSLFWSVLFFDALSAVLLWRCLKIRSVYAKSIYQTLGGDKGTRLMRLLNLKMDQLDDSVLEFLSELMNDSDPEVAEFALTCVARIPSGAAFKKIRTAFSAVPPQRQARMLRVLAGQGGYRLAPLFESGLHSPDSRVVARSVAALGRVPERDPRPLLLPFLNHPKARVRVQAVVALWPWSDGPARKALLAILDRLLGSHRSPRLALVAGALGRIGDPALMDRLYRVIQNPLLGLASGDNTYLPVVVSALGRFKTPYSASLLLSYVRRAGERELALIEEGLGPVLSGNPPLVEKALQSPDPKVRRAVVRALIGQREKVTSGVKSVLEPALEEELKCLYVWVQYAAVLRTPAGMLSEVVMDNLVRRQFDHVIHLFRLLDATDALSTVVGKMTSRDKHVRSTAIELLENNVKSRYARLFIPLCEEKDPVKLATLAKPVWRIPQADIYFVLSALFGGEDPWIKAFTLYTALTLAESSGENRPLETLKFRERSQALRALAGFAHAQ